MERDAWTGANLQPLAENINAHPFGNSLDIASMPSSSVVKSHSDTWSIDSGTIGTAVCSFKKVSNVLGESVPQLADEFKLKVNQSIDDYRSKLVRNVVLRAENGLARQGWAQQVDMRGGQRWGLPPDRKMILMNGKVYGQFGLWNTDLYRNPDGTIFHANPITTPEVKQVYFLDRERLNSAIQNGALNPRELSLFNRLSMVEQEMAQLNSVQQQMRDSTSSLSQTSKCWNHHTSSNALAPDTHASLQRYNDALAAGRNEMAAQQRRYDASIRQGFRDVGILAGCHLTNRLIDSELFDSVPVSTRTAAIDLLAPAISFAPMHWGGRAAIIVGSHLIARFADERLKK